MDVSAAIKSILNSSTAVDSAIRFASSMNSTGFESTLDLDRCETTGQPV
jgi:hypothetical protein